MIRSDVTRWILVMLATFALSLCLSYLLSGCTPSPVQEGAKSAISLFHAPKAGVGVSDLYAPLGWLAIIGVIGVAVGIGLYAFVSKSLGLAVGGSAAALEASSLVLRVALPFIPWVVGGLGIVAVVFGIIELTGNGAALQSFFGLGSSTAKAATPTPVTLTPTPPVK
jgi:hypothetical protein